MNDHHLQGVPVARRLLGEIGSGKLVNVNPHASRLTFCIVIARMVNQAGL